MTRRCSRRPLSLATGARPARAATLRRSRLPSSGISASRVAARIGPQPGIEVSRAKSAASAASAWIVCRSSLASSFASWRRKASVFLTRSRIAGVRRCSSCCLRTVISSLSWRRQARISRSSVRAGSGSGVARRADHLAVARDQPGIDPVGLGLQAHAAREVAHPLRVDDRRQHALRHELLVRGPLIAAGSFHHHQAAGRFAQRPHQRLDPGRIVADPKPPPAASPSSRRARPC